jgi:hypothetical protein
MQGFELKSPLMGNDHSQKVKATLPYYPDPYTQVIIDLLQAPRSDVRHIFPRFVTFFPWRK